jgi:hypothetical protein
MTIQAKHFDTRLNQWIHTDGDVNNPDSRLKEELNNTLLEHFLPGVNFSFGHMDEKSKAEQLHNHPEGHKLLLSSKTRLLYGSEECLETINKLCPDNKDRGAYGSIFLGSCKNALNRELNILIVDDSNGENGGIINNEQAYHLTGDCYGQISTELYHELTGHQDGDKYRVIQHRFGWTDQDGDDNKFRFGKGTLRPANLDQILNYQDPNQPKVDLILPLSAFKGTDKDNPKQPTKPQIQPGLYKQNIWLGEKSQSELGKTAISQMLASFPNGMQDFTERLELEAKKLKEAQDDPRKLAQLYCEKYEKRKAFLEEQAASLEEEAENPTITSDLETPQQPLDDTNIYKLIKADIMGEGQLLETEKVQRELARFVQNEWKEIAIGKSLTFERAMVIPSKDLENGEISIPHYQDGEEILNFRSPFLNSNGLCVSTNKVVEDITGPDGKPLAGVIAVSDETSEHIYNRLNKQVKSILPEVQGKSLQIEGIEDYLDKNIGKLETKDKIEFTNKFNEYIKELQSSGYSLKILPQESEQERQARDYDGDYIGFEQASKYPNLTAEAIERNLPENAYDPTVKLKKQSFYRENGSQPEFEEIAIHMSDSISVGTINNHLTSIEALESEITILKNFGSEKDLIEYVQQVAKHYEELFETEAKSKGVEGKEVPEKYRGYMEEFVQTVRQEPLTQANALKAMGINTQMYRELVAEAAFQNQIAVDLFKSAKKPEMDIIRANTRILHREVNYIKDKKKDVYLDDTIKPTGYSPVELLITQANKYFEKAKLESRELTQFSNLFKGIEFTHEQRLKATIAKKEFDKEFNNATHYSQRKKVEKGPSVSIDIVHGNKLDVTNLLQYDHPLIWKAQIISLKISEVPLEKRSQEKPHKYKVYAQINNETENGKPKFRTLGTLAKDQENKLQDIGIAPGQEVTSNKISFQPELSEGQIKLLYQKAYQVAEFYNSIPDDQKLAIASASWAVSTTRESSNDKSNDQRKVSNFAFAAFSKEIIGQLDTLKFNEFSITAFDRNSELFQDNQPQKIRFNLAENSKNVIEIQNPDGNYQTFGNIEQNNARLPLGTTANANLEKGEIYTATVTTKITGQPEVNFKVGELNKFGNTQRFDNEPVVLTIEKVKLRNEDYSIYIQNGNKPEKLGNIDKESVKEGITQGWLAENPGSGQQLQLKIQTITTGQNAYAIAQTNEDNLLRVNITSLKYKKQVINDQQFRQTSIRAFDKNHVYVARIGDRALGIIGQHTERVEAELSRGNAPKQWGRKEDSTIEKLIKSGIIRENQQRTTIPVEITSNESTCKIIINPETIQYPEQWIKRSQLISNEQPVRREQEQKSNKIIDKINERPTIMFQDKEQKIVGLVGLTIDEKLADKTKNYLDKVGVSYEQLPQSQTKLEAKKGMTVFILDESTISSELKKTFIERAGGKIKSAVTPEQPIPIIPEQTIYFSNSNQQYTLDDGSQITKEAIGLVVPNQDTIAVNRWLESKSIDSSYYIDNNTATFFIEKNSISSDIQNELSTLLGEAIDITNNHGFDNYEQLIKKLNTRLQTEDSLLPPNPDVPDSEYKQILKAVLNRPKELSQEGSRLPITPAKPFEEIVQQQPANIPPQNNTEVNQNPIPQANTSHQLTVETQQEKSPQTNGLATNPLSQLKPINDAVAEHMKKDMAMAEVATQFIGKSAAPPETPSSTRNYEQAWGQQANTGNYSKDDIIMVSGSGPWRGVTSEQILQTFENHYKPLLDKAIEAKSSFVAGNAKGTDQLVQNYLQEKGYKLEQTSKGYNLFDPVENTKINSSNISFNTHADTSPKDKIPKEIAPGINFNSRGSDPLGAVLTSTTVKSKQVGTIKGDYPVSFRDNKEMSSGNYGPETYIQSKPEGQPFLSAEQAFYAYKETLPLGEPRVQLMAEILTARFEQHPKLAQAITEKGGVEWLESCTYKVSPENSKVNFWEGEGLKSPYIRAITQAYTNVLEKNQVQEQSAVETSAPSISRDKPTITQQQTQQLDIEQALNSSISNPKQQVGAMDGIIEQMKANTVQTLQDWHMAAQQLGKGENYLNRIQEVTDLYIKENINLNNAFIAMGKDLKALESVNEMTSLAQRVVKTIGKEDANGVMSVETQKYKIATKAQDKTYLIKDKNNDVLLYIKQGKTQINKINDEIMQDFRFKNFRIDNSLEEVKQDLVER